MNRHMRYYCIVTLLIALLVFSEAAKEVIENVEQVIDDVTPTDKSSAAADPIGLKDAIAPPQVGQAFGLPGFGAGFGSGGLGPAGLFPALFPTLTTLLGMGSFPSLLGSPVPALDQQPAASKVVLVLAEDRDGHLKRRSVGGQLRRRSRQDAAQGGEVSQAENGQAEVSQEPVGQTPEEQVGQEAVGQGESADQEAVGQGEAQVGQGPLGQGPLGQVLGQGPLGQVLGQGLLGQGLLGQIPGFQQLSQQMSQLPPFNMDVGQQLGQTQQMLQQALPDIGQLFPLSQGLLQQSSSASSGSSGSESSQDPTQLVSQILSQFGPQFGGLLGAPLDQGEGQQSEGGQMPFGSLQSAFTDGASMLGQAFTKFSIPNFGSNPAPPAEEMGAQASEISEVRVKPDTDGQATSLPSKTTFSEKTVEMKNSTATQELQHKKAVPLLWFRLPEHYSASTVSREDLQIKEKLQAFERQVIRELKQLQEIERQARELRAAARGRTAKTVNESPYKVSNPLSKTPIHKITHEDIEKALKDEYVKKLLQKATQRYPKEFGKVNLDVYPKHITVTEAPIKREISDNDPTAKTQLSKDDIIKILAFAYRMAIANKTMATEVPVESHKDITSNGNTAGDAQKLSQVRQWAAPQEQTMSDQRQWVNAKLNPNHHQHHSQHQQSTEQRQWADHQQNQPEAPKESPTPTAEKRQWFKDHETKKADWRQWANEPKPQKTAQKLQHQPHVTQVETETAEDAGKARHKGDSDPFDTLDLFSTSGGKDKKGKGSVAPTIVNYYYGSGGSGSGGYGGSNSGYGSNSGGCGSNGESYGSTGGSYGSNGGSYGTNGGSYGNNGGSYGNNGGSYGSKGGSYGSNGGYGNGGGNSYGGSSHNSNGHYGGGNGHSSHAYNGIGSYRVAVGDAEIEEMLRQDRSLAATLFRK